MMLLSRRVSNTSGNSGPNGCNYKVMEWEREANFARAFRQAEAQALMISLWEVASKRL